MQWVTLTVRYHLSFQEGEFETLYRLEEMTDGRSPLYGVQPHVPQSVDPRGG